MKKNSYKAEKEERKKEKYFERKNSMIKKKWSEKVLRRREKKGKYSEKGKIKEHEKHKWIRER